tara:strand:- start:1460 stop:1858 length:399 start_codon:yes stop_codon:yes gene_type:complete
MDDSSPMFTMVKSKTVGDAPQELSEKSQGLLETLTMLCSFYSAEDLASFLFTPMFSELARQDEVWLGFEIGLYVDHTKTLELFPSHVELLLVDNASTGVFTESIHRCVHEQDVVQQLENWYSVVHSAGARFE